MSSCLWHPSHPFQLCTIEIVCPCYLRTTVVNAFLALLQIIGVITTIGIDSLVVQLQDNGTYPIQEETVMRHHQQCLISSCQIPLQPFYHLQVEMVGRLVKNQKVRFHQQHISKGYALLLSTTQLSHRLLQVTDLQSCQHLLRLQYFLRLSLMVETRIQHTLLRIECRRLLQIACL